MSVYDGLILIPPPLNTTVAKLALWRTQLSRLQSLSITCLSARHDMVWRKMASSTGFFIKIVSSTCTRARHSPFKPSDFR